MDILTKESLTGGNFYGENQPIVSIKKNYQTIRYIRDCRRYIAAAFCRHNLVDGTRGGPGT